MFGLNTLFSWHLINCISVVALEISKIAGWEDEDILPDFQDIVPMTGRQEQTNINVIKWVKSADISLPHLTI